MKVYCTLLRTFDFARLLASPWLSERPARFSAEWLIPAEEISLFFFHGEDIWQAFPHSKVNA